MTVKTVLKLIEKLLPDVADMDLCEDDFEYICKHNEKLDKFVDFWKFGATKGVLKFKGMKNVIKIPFTYNCDMYFENAGYPIGDNENKWDHCKTECDVYETSKYYSISKFFSAIKRVGTIGSCPVYEQEYTEVMDWDKMYSFEEKEKARITKMRDTIKSYGIYYIFNDMWLTLAYEYYGAEAVVELLDFLKRYYLDLDLHMGNLGFVVDGSKKYRPVILDYSGYFSDWDIDDLEYREE